MRTHIPNFITFTNLALGILAIVFVFHGEYTISSLLILTAALMDRFDGQLARKLDAESDIGKQLDSLCDLISFGVAPAILIWNHSFLDLGIIGVLPVIAFPLAGAYRLAKFNVIDFDGFFSGIPITLAGSFIALITLFIINYNIVDKKIETIAIYVFVWLLSYAMISQKIKLRKK